MITAHCHCIHVAVNIIVSLCVSLCVDLVPYYAAVDNGSPSTLYGVACVTINSMGTINISIVVEAE